MNYWKKKIIKKKLTPWKKNFKKELLIFIKRNVILHNLLKIK